MDTHRNDEQTFPVAGSVLLTGATGYLGVHLLRELIETTTLSVCCLARGKTDAAALANLARQVEWYFPDWSQEAWSPRVKVVRGDLEAPQLGLSNETWAELANGQDGILNAAADVHHVGAASRSFKINTEAVAMLIELARQGKSKPLHHISTISIRGEFEGTTGVASFKEAHLEEGQSLSDAYAESKHRAEVAMRKAFAEGMTGAVYRVGYVGPHFVTGRYQRNIHQSNTARYVRASVRLGFAPYLPKESVQLTPSDVAARAIVQLMTRGAQSGPTYFIEHPQRIAQYDVLRVLQAAGYPLRLMPLSDFSEKSPRMSQDAESLDAITPAPPDGKTRVAPVDSTWSQRELRRLGFEYPRLNSGWLSLFLRHAIEVGFIEAPRHWNVAPAISDLF